MVPHCFLPKEENSVLSGFDQGFEEGLRSRLRFARGPERRRSSLGMPPFIL